MPGHARAAEDGSKEALPIPLAVILHLLPGALLVWVVLLLVPPLIARGVPQDLVHVVPRC